MSSLTAAPCAGTYCGAERNSSSRHVTSRLLRLIKERLINRRRLCRSSAPRWQRRPLLCSRRKLFWVWVLNLDPGQELLLLLLLWTSWLKDKLHHGSLSLQSEPSVKNVCCSCRTWSPRQSSVCVTHTPPQTQRDHERWASGPCLPKQPWAAVQATDPTAH